MFTWPSRSCRDVRRPKARFQRGRYGWLSLPASLPISPMVWTSARMRDGDDVDVVLANAVHHLVWKPVDFELTAAQSSRPKSTRFWVGLNQVDRRDHCVEQLCAETVTAPLVPADRRGQLRGRR